MLNTFLGGASPFAGKPPRPAIAEQWRAWLETAAMSTGAAMLEYIQTAHRIEEAAKARKEEPYHRTMTCHRNTIKVCSKR